MRQYINDGLAGAAVVLTLGLGVFGAGLSLIGGLIRRQPPFSPSTLAGKRTKT
jgi:hypothetical protein